MSEGVKHLIECHCILPQYRNKKERKFHKFIVFSIVDDSNTVIPKFSQCNNCGVVHKVYDLCKSEIMTGKEEIKAVTSIDDIKLLIPSSISNVLENYQVDLPTWEHAKWILDNKKWGSFIVLEKETIKDEIQGKMLLINDKDNLSIETFTYATTIENTEIPNGNE